MCFIKITEPASNYVENFLKPWETAYAHEDF